MQSKKKKTIANVIMCLIIAIVAISGTIVVNSVKSHPKTTKKESITLNTKEYTTVKKSPDSKDSMVDVKGDVVEKTTKSTTIMSKDSVTTQNQTSKTTTQTNKTNAVLKCTIEIKCVTILSNMDNFNPEKKQFVPADGVILQNISVEFKDGETVFDILNRVCAAYNIELEYSYTPLYKSYYIESINHLREFDCKGSTPDKNLSGWMYSVNGTYPNYGCSLYHLKNNDAIKWDYTCNGYGADIS